MTRDIGSLKQAAAQLKDIPALWRDIAALEQDMRITQRSVNSQKAYCDEHFGTRHQIEFIHKELSTKSNIETSDGLRDRLSESQKEYQDQLEHLSRKLAVTDDKL